MTKKDWQNFLAGEYAALAGRLQLQGYTPQLLGRLEREVPFFRQRLDQFHGELKALAEGMEREPDRYEWFEHLRGSMHALLCFTGQHRGLALPDLGCMGASALSDLAV
jgi:hypothetical protein